MPPTPLPEAEGVESELAPDNVLAMLVHIANTSDVEMGLTIHVAGLVVTGRLISGATFWVASAQKLRESGQGPTELIEPMAESMEKVAQAYRDAYAEDPTDPGDPSTSAFVHMRDAHTLVPQGPTPTAGALWRGRLASIDGFSFGELKGMS
jgi:hypothetical protein